ncbi:hypothetical protein M378DRAFT_19760 [Amanita muscaria Koide BX008]|uniref:F-box domain-containing protein n=1 Tax=Amanita muscaria (strain Koide BX008) TaxID=946122 RepID=A0A0C2TVQ4_AMAMK|nr:hypothetical protein M378DRAFT_19760 [Amanita muscaria Koide BX008]
MSSTRPRKKCKRDDDESGAILTVARAPVRKKGKLAALIQMPLDVLYEIFSHLNSPDVLKLSRMSKVFRRVLMSPSALSIWKSARENIGLPECPPDMNEIQWANLAFSPHCHYCFTTGVRTVEWRFRMRICSKCAKDHLLVMHNMPTINHMTHDLVPCRPAARRWRIVVVKVEWEEVQQQIKALDKKDLDAYTQRRKEKVVEITRHAERCESWAQDQNNGRALERDQLKAERLNSIVEKLKALGWEKDLQSIRYPDSLEEHKLVKLPQRLTTRIWSNIQGPILQFMTEMREKRILREQKEVVMRRKRTATTVLQEYKNGRLPYREVMPEAVDFCDMPPVKAIIDQSLDVPVDATAFSHLITQFPQLFDSWRNKIRLQLAELLKRSGELQFFFDDELDIASPDCGLRKVPETDSEALEMLNLASTIFICKECGPALFTFLDMSLDRPIFYPEVLGHICLTRRYSYGLLPSDPTDPSLDLGSTPALKRASWHTRPLMLSSTLRSMAEELIADSGLDPQTAEASDMDNKNLFYACLRCHQHQDTGDIIAPVYKWRDAICHQAATHNMMESEWYIASEDEFETYMVESDEDEDESEAEDIGDEEYEGGKEAMCPIWCCTRCRDTPLEKGPMDLPSMADHYLFQHECYGDLILNRDYFRSFDTYRRKYSSPPKMFVPSI